MAASGHCAALRCLKTCVAWCPSGQIVTMETSEGLLVEHPPCPFFHRLNQQTTWLRAANPLHPVLQQASGGRVLTKVFASFAGGVPKVNRNKRDPALQQGYWSDSDLACFRCLQKDNGPSQPKSSSRSIGWDENLSLTACEQVHGLSRHGRHGPRFLFLCSNFQV